MPTIRRCCIVGCLSNSRQNPQLQFFQFPRPENPFHKLWKQACQASLSRILPFKKPVVCALHFRPNCIGGRRLTSSAVPSLRLEVPQDLKAVEQQAMVEEIERSRKCAYINAVVYEWLVRANLNPQLRGSITHGMIKEKAETARQIIGSTIFIADNRWLNRFRETHLTGFAQKLASNQLKPVGSSLWIPDIVQDLQQMFPPTADRMNFENVPEQYYDYMQQRYGEYEEDDEEQNRQGNFQGGSNPYAQQDSKSSQQQQQQSPHSGHQMSQHGYSNNFEPYGHIPYAGGYDDYYYQQQERQQQQYHNQQQHSNYHHTPPPISISPHTPSNETSNSQTQVQNSRPSSRSPNQRQSSPISMQHDGNSRTPRLNDTENPAKRARYENSDDVQDDREDDDSNDVGEQQQNDDQSEISRRSSSSDNEAASDNTGSNGNENGTLDKDEDAPSPVNSLGNHNGHTIRPIQLPKHPIQNKTSNGNGNGNSTPTTNGYSSSSPTNKKNGTDSEKGSTGLKRIELQTYAQALEYMKPLEDFVLLKENFRAIGIISHLESVLRKARNRTRLSEANDEH